MIRLDPKAAPYWLDIIPGLRIKVRPCSTALIFAARQTAASVEGSGAEAEGARWSAFLTGLAQLAITEWEGVGDAEGNPAPVNAENVAALLDHHVVADVFNAAFLAPALMLDAEKNG